jgi:hypothetical protein
VHTVTVTPELTTVSGDAATRVRSWIWLVE